MFRSVWWVSNALLILALTATVWSGVWEYSMRQYLQGFSDAIVPESAAPQAKVEAILAWIRSGRLKIPRFHLRTNLSRATAAFFSTPEIN